MEWKKTPLNTESNTPAGEAEIPEASTAPKGKGKKATVEDESDEDLYTDPNQNNN
jgi:hypothetical protein